MLGRFENKRALEVIKRSAFLVFSSLLYETFGRTIVEAFACGKPVIASHHGTSTELIEDGKTGLFFLPGNPRDLRRKVNILWNSPELRVQMGKNARNVYQEKYTRDQNYARLAEIYREAIKSKDLILSEREMEKVKLLGVGINRLSLGQLLDIFPEIIDAGEEQVISYVNIHTINIAYVTPWFRDFMNQSYLTFCDGIGVVLAAKLTGQTLKYRYTPPDFFERICELALKKKWRIFFWGQNLVLRRRLQMD